MLLNNDNGVFIIARFTGHQYDTVIDVYFAQARFYDAKNRQWMSSDPMKDGLNWYQYVGSNPATWVDPSGLFQLPYSAHPNTVPPHLRVEMDKHGNVVITAVGEAFTGFVQAIPVAVSGAWGATKEGVPQFIVAVPVASREFEASLGLGGQIVLGFTPASRVMSGFYAYDGFANWEYTPEHAVQLVFNTWSLLSGIKLNPGKKCPDLSKANYTPPAQNPLLTKSKPGTLTGKLDGLTSAERKMVNDLLEKGNNVQIVPKNPALPTPDFRINGVPTELKTLKNPNVTTGVGRIQDGFKQNASTVIIDARGTGLTNAQAQEMINRAAGTYSNKQLPGNVQVWIDSGIVFGG